jgi:glyceraldehyde 3-phosphate dehydrogenase
MTISTPGGGRQRSVLGINGLGRIGKMLLWHFVHTRAFDEVVVNTGREVGRSLDDAMHVIESDSTYGPIESFLYGLAGKRDVRVVDEGRGAIEIHGLPVRILRTARNPRDICWRKEGVRLVVEATGAFLDPTVAIDEAKGSLRGHLAGGASAVLASAPFKIKDKAASVPDDSAMLIHGINHTSFDPLRHRVISAASCTTTGLAHMVKPLLETEETSRILTASLSTIHAATNTQNVLDAVPSSSASDLRKSRSVFDNIILSSTGAARALEQVLPEIKRVGFMADSVRIPTSSVSLINLNLTFHSPLDERGRPAINRPFLNDVYRRAAAGAQQGLLRYSDRQNVSKDLLGVPAAVVIEGHETHTRTGFIELPADALRAAGMQAAEPLRVPVTHAKIFGWYDNEYGSYVTSLAALATYIDRSLPR